ncbi:MAG: RnfABCDGE type electron transport complex subunit D [Candidatus Gygaella obscura]|nr:RnfABCDGE type electron transport complex subunit D [Candidatus Gygaella obscura]
MQDKLFVQSSPHIHSNKRTRSVIWAVFFALIPAGAASVFIFGIASLKVMVVCVLTCVATEGLLQRMVNRPVAIKDGSAVLTGLLLAYNLPANIPLWIPLVGSIFAIAICKLAFGGLGRNIFNPALAARAFLLASWPQQMTSFIKPFAVDSITKATPLMMFNEAKVTKLSELNLSYIDLLLGNRGGCLGEVCIIALLLGAVFLIAKGIIKIYIPFSFILTTGLFSWVFGYSGIFKGDFLFSILSGGLILGAFFMATDYVTSPVSKNGQIIFGIGCGLLTFIIRKFTGYPEGVSYSILIMNAAAPLIDRHIRPHIYGKTKK